MYLKLRTGEKGKRRWRSEERRSFGTNFPPQTFTLAHSELLLRPATKDGASPPSLEWLELGRVRRGREAVMEAIVHVWYLSHHPLQKSPLGPSSW